MSKRVYLLNLFKDIADAIRAKTGQTRLYEIEELPDRIMDISTGTTTSAQTKSVEITSNGNQSITPDDGYVLDKVNLSVSVPQNNRNNVLIETYSGGKLVRSIKSIDCSNWDTSNVTDMESMFAECYSLSSLDLSNFDTSKVTNMLTMFSNCKAFTSLNLSSFDTSSVTNMFGIFYNCLSLISLDLSSFDTSKVTNMNNMFYNCKALISLDLSNFNTSKVIYMDYMFKDCISLTTLTLGSNWASNEKVTSISLLNSSKLTHDSCLDVLNKLATRTNSPTLQLHATTKALLSADEIKIATDKGWVVS